MPQPTENIAPLAPEKEPVSSGKDPTDPTAAFNHLVEVTRKLLPTQDLSVLKRAYDYAALKHGAQKRQSGEPYITHPLLVATITAELRLDLASIVAAILHDVVEDTATTLEDVEKEFGKQVADLVDGLTKIAKIEFKSNHERLAENFRKMVMAMAKDIRVILIKLADRTHNMRTIKALPLAKRKRIAQETMDIYAPLANRLGMYQIKSELEDLCLRQLKPEVYEEIKRNVSIKKAERQKQTAEVKAILMEELQKYGFKNAEVTGRAKHFYSIYKKVTERDLSYEDIHDLFAFRIIVDTVKDCYEALGIVHAMWKPMPGRFKDYIAMPKANMYQSLHTTVIRPNGEPAEIQIRTREMHAICEYGVAAHWSYKERGSSVAPPNPEIQKMAWLKQIVEWQNELKDPDEFLEAVKVDLFQDEIFVFTPKGDVIQLPSGATALDFAFGVHSQVGSTTVGAKVNGSLVPIKKVLKSGDIIEVITSAKQQPTKDWLNFVTTSKAKNKIRSHLRQNQRDQSKTLGKDLLVQGLHDRNLEFEKIQKTGELEHLIRSSKEANVDDLLCNIGYGKTDLKELLNKAFPQKETPKTLQESQFTEIEKANQPRKPFKPKGILVSGLDNILINFAKCCNPLPGEEIVGFVTRGKGVTIHRHNCPRSLDIDPARKVDVDWGSPGTENQQDFTTYLTVISRDRPGILADVTLAISNTGANISKAQVHVGKDMIGYLDFEVMVKSHPQMQLIIAKIESIESVIRVERKSTAPTKSQKKGRKKK